MFRRGPAPQPSAGHLHSLNMFHAYGFLAEVFGILARHRISVDLITTSEVSVSLTLDHTGSQSKRRTHPQRQGAGGARPAAARWRWRPASPWWRSSATA